ncbi:MAG: YihY/virulence factor BrkB family protein [Acidobacteria bacterium]|nr:YihY/virulence factor BrkB family protein [Acidobacteriota bacterium]
MQRFWRYFRGALRRTFPSAQIYAQAVAFNSFLALFPMLLVILGLLTAIPRLSGGVEDLINRVLTLLPPNSRQTVVDYLLSFGEDPVKWVLLGIGGTLFAGCGAMASLTQGFRAVHGDEQPKGFWREQFRAFALLSMTFVPWVVSAVITVFGRQSRHWLIQQLGLPDFVNLIWTILHTALAIVLAMITLALIYHFGRPKRGEWSEVWPGTFVATGLWFVVNLTFAYYVREVPYRVIYGGLAAAIGLLVWMYLSAMVVYIGAGYNAEAAARAPDPIYLDSLRIDSGAVPVVAEKTDTLPDTPPAKG